MIYYDDHETDCRERRIDCDLSDCCEFNDVGNGFRLEDVAYVLASVMGENDGPEYYWLVVMRDHTYAVVYGGCDYTGWTCNSSGHASIFVTLRSALESLPKHDEKWYNPRSIQKSIKMQLVGELAFGEVKQ